MATPNSMVSSSVDLSTVDSPSMPSISQNALSWTESLVVFIGVLVIIVTVTGNVLVIISYIQDSQIRRMPGNQFILSLSVSDLLIGLISLPLYLYNFVTKTWPLGDLLCSIYTAFDYSIILLSTVTVIFISLDRYWMVTKKLKYRSFQTRKRSQIMIISSWVITSVVVSTLLLTWSSIYTDVSPFESHICNPVILKTQAGSVVVMVTFITLPSLLMIYSNACVFVHILRRSKTFEGNQKTNKKTKKDSSHKKPTRFPKILETAHDNISRGDLNQGLNHGFSGLVKSNVDGNFMMKLDEKPIGNNSNTQFIHSPDRTTSYTEPCTVGTSRCKLHLEEQANSSPGGELDTSCWVNVPGDTERSPPVTVHIGDTDVDMMWSNLKAVVVEQANIHLNQACGGTGTSASVASEIAGQMRIHETGELSRIRRAAFTLTMLVVVYSICWSPYAISRVYDSFCRDCLDFVTMEVTRILVWLNSTVNPMLYAATNPRFRKNFKRLLNLRNITD